jgi:non-heme chloroperoxidase
LDHYADDLAALTARLDLKNAIHVGHSTGGGEVARYLARHGENRVSKAILISAVPPLMVKTPANPLGLPKQVFDDFQAALAANHSQFYRDIAAGLFYGFNRPDAKPSEAPTCGLRSFVACRLVPRPDIEQEGPVCHGPQNHGRQTKPRGDAVEA